MSTAAPTIGGRDVTEWRSVAGRALARRHRRLARRVGPRRALALLLVAGGGAAVAATWASALIAEQVSDQDGISQLDRPALRLAERMRGPVVDAVAAGIARVFGPVGLPVLAVAAAAALSAEERRRSPLILTAATGAGSLAMTLAGKGIVHRARPPRRDAIPPYESSPSFPSGHTLNTTALTGVLAYLLMLREPRVPEQVATASAATAVSAAVGLSRVLLGAHWFTDVAMGWAAGSGWLAVVITVSRLHLTGLRHDRTGSPPISPT